LLGVAGDQQAASFGQACFRPGDVKSTYGTGCFALVNTGAGVPVSQNRLLATSAYRAKGETAYAIEGSIFVAGAVVQWLRDAMGLIRSADEIEALARTAKSAEGLYFVPAFTGLGAPYWDPDARAAILGLTRDMGVAEIARAALDAVCFQTRDLLDAMARDMAAANLGAPGALKVDGGMVKNDWFCQRLADLTGLTVDRPKITETTALGAAYLAGLSAGVFRDFSEISKRLGAGSAVRARLGEIRPRRPLRRLAEGGRAGAVNSHPLRSKNFSQQDQNGCSLALKESLARFGCILFVWSAGFQPANF
jgi:glycerol kinase